VAKCREKKARTSGMVNALEEEAVRQTVTPDAPDVDILDNTSNV
jgi:hypothetical protein